MDEERKMEREFVAFWQKESLAPPQSHVLAAVSGGADSVCLLRLLNALKDELGIRISVFHFNHCLRQTADRDENFVKTICDGFSLPLYVRRADVAACARERHLSIEEAGRLLRYEAAEEVMKECGAGLLATAHQQMDQAETLLFALCRGTGLDGMGGIRPKRGSVIRPLLFASREQIEGYLRAAEQDFVTDETNADERFSRNLIRRRVLPLLQGRVNPASAVHMAETAEQVRLANDFIMESVKKAYRDVLITENDKEAVLSVAGLARLDPFLQSEVVHFAIGRVAGSSKDISRVHVRDTLSLVQGISGRRIMLPYRLVAERSFDELRIAREDGERMQGGENTAGEVIVSKQMLTENNGFLTLDGPGGLEICLRVMEAGTDGISAKNIPQKGYTKWLDYDKINERVTFRGYREGDYFYLDETHKKSAKAYFRDRKIPVREQRQRLLMAEDSHALVIFPERISYKGRLTESTKWILEVEVKNGQGRETD